MKLTVTSDNYCYVDHEQECSFKYNGKTYVEYVVDLRFRKKEKIDKRTIYVYSFNMFTKQGKAMLEKAIDMCVKIPWNIIEKGGDYCEIETISFNKIKNKKLKEFILDIVTEAFEEIK